ncbi:hypothetical protein TVAG_059600 [Trichomonas vaginalis G3]|uniref:Uncharacterized protein n=1 Tax=Trichomonas vaginalis (strain ATCC PRA-98 / G3) TaxID=412133 RepID=A2FB12_TRIV3|nr:hypothetical protein TVAGG3_0710240 [Trichomonas vaginalis G3]EAX97895.1 hypothetical protein TVAG_059600 [Trichomonas vaginalis G3]KAI5509846.1 hypothetical protein TVAGG3_0710240 [Trichomonas vaginalis G3]|eukprot:XP_001310825.1 hypothetical protein [Trichomonas vaginalis G3]
MSSVSTPMTSPYRTPIKSPHSKDPESARKNLLKKEHDLNKLEILNLKDANLKCEQKANELKKQKTNLANAIKAEQKLITTREKEYKEELEQQIELEKQKMNTQISEIKNEKENQRKDIINSLQRKIRQILDKLPRSNADGHMMLNIENDNIQQMKAEFHSMVLNWNSQRQLSDIERLNLKLRKTLLMIKENTYLNIPPHPKLFIEKSHEFETEYSQHTSYECHQTNVNYTKLTVEKHTLLISS